MPHYAHVLMVNRLQLEVHLGFYEKERLKKQKIEVSFRLYFPNAIPANSDDHAAFYDYGKLADFMRDCLKDRKFNLIEFLSVEMFRWLRERIDGLGGKDVKIWLELNKIEAPVPGLMGGASFIYSDLPPDATYIPSTAP